MSFRRWETAWALKQELFGLSHRSLLVFLFHRIVRQWDESCFRIFANYANEMTQVRSTENYSLQLVHDNEEWLEIQKTDLRCARQAIDRLRNKLFTLRLNKLQQRSTPGSVYCVNLKFPQRYCWYSDSYPKINIL